MKKKFKKKEKNPKQLKKKFPNIQRAKQIKKSTCKTNPKKKPKKKNPN